jgi:hypothetical protein
MLLQIFAPKTPNEARTELEGQRLVISPVALLTSHLVVLCSNLNPPFLDHLAPFFIFKALIVT